MRSNSLLLYCSLRIPQPFLPVPLAPSLRGWGPLSWCIWFSSELWGRAPTCQPPALSAQQALLLPGTTRLTSTRIRSGMSTGSLMTWWLRSSSLRAASCGPARTMTEMCSRTSWRRVCWEHHSPRARGVGLLRLRDFSDPFHRELLWRGALARCRISHGQQGAETL